MTLAAQYLERHAEPEARALLETAPRGHWQHVLVVPAYGESSDVLGINAAFDNTLLILVLNRPDTDPDTCVNEPLRKAAQALPEVQDLRTAHASLRQLPGNSQVLLLERPGGLPRNEGVGLARKIGCDAALALHALGGIGSTWIHSSDADATLPADYFDAARHSSAAVALSYPYRHDSPEDPRERAAIDLYERHLEHYVAGLRKAGSPYAFQTLGSCIAVQAKTYAQVRGFPRRAGGEDFYLLNKIAKHGPVAVPRCGPIRLSARLSQRVPFGTGPALLKLLEREDPVRAPLFYHPRCFDELQALIQVMTVHGHPDMTIEDVQAVLVRSPDVMDAVQQLGLATFLQHARRQAADAEAFRRQFHQWFDGFRTLKCVHALSERWGRITAGQLDQLGIGQTSQRDASPVAVAGAASASSANHSRSSTPTLRS